METRKNAAGAFFISIAADLAIVAHPFFGEYTILWSALAITAITGGCVVRGLQWYR